MDRYLENQIARDLKKKMVFIVGPRQVGKTWLAKKIAAEYSNPLYLNYDNLSDRELIINQSWFPEVDLIIFDEIHKMEKWKNYLKGVYDTKPKDQNILVTGSARLDTFRKSGDALSGRFFSFRLMPISYKEIGNTGRNWRDFIFSSGYPEPFLADSETDIKRWRKQYVDGMIRNDILDFEKIRDFKSMYTLLELLRNRVGSKISFSSLAEDIGTSANTVTKYVDILESLFIIFKVHPYHKNISRALKKDAKIYFYDTGLVKGDDGIKAENLVALSLLKHVYGEQDLRGRELNLHFLRTKDKREVDFCLAEDDKLLQLIEVKLSDDKPAKNLLYFRDRLTVPATQVVFNLKNEKIAAGVRFESGIKFLSRLNH